MALNEGQSNGQDEGAAALDDLDDAELRRRVLELGRSGLCRRRIAQALGVPERRVRAALQGVDSPGTSGTDVVTE